MVFVYFGVGGCELVVDGDCWLVFDVAVADLFWSWCLGLVWGVVGVGFGGCVVYLECVGGLFIEFVGYVVHCVGDDCCDVVDVCGC